MPEHSTVTKERRSTIHTEPSPAMRPSIATKAAALCLVVAVSSSCTLCVVRAGAADEPPKIRAAAAAVKNTNRNNRVRRRASNIRGDYDWDENAHYHGAATDPTRPSNRQLHEGDQPWYDPDLHGDEGKHDISHARPVDDVDDGGGGSLPDLISPPANDLAEGRNADIDYDEVMVHAQVMPDEYRTETPTASPPAQGAAQKVQETNNSNNNNVEGQGRGSDTTDGGKIEAEICTTEVCFLGESIWTMTRMPF